MRHKITVPGAGKEKVFQINGYSMIVESGKIYNNATEVPLLGFNSGNNELGIYPRSTYGNNGERIKKIIVTGTAESEGDVFYILSTNECLKTQLNIVYADNYSSVPGETFTKGATDVAQSLSEIELMDSDGNLPSKIYVSSTNGEIRYTFDVAPNQANPGNAHVLKEDAVPLEIIDLAWILAFQFIASPAGATPNLVVTCEY